MRYKEFIVKKLEEQINMIQSLERTFDSGTISKHEALLKLNQITKGLSIALERLELE
jgi:hypothetical protein